MALVQSGLVIQLIYSPHDEYKEQQQIEVTQCFGQENRPQIALIRKLVEDGTGGAAHGVFEIDTIAKIHSQSDAVDDQIYPSTNSMVGFVLFAMPWKQH